jgi:hypothetical protein
MPYPLSKNRDAIIGQYASACRAEGRPCTRPRSDRYKQGSGMGLERYRILIQMLFLHANSLTSLQAERIILY